MAGTQLIASYKSPTSTQTMSIELPTPPKDGAGSVQDKTAYLSALRAKASEMQSEINAFLTQKMEEDKAAESNKSAADQREEERYGEEDPENDA